MFATSVYLSIHVSIYRFLFHVNFNCYLLLSLSIHVSIHRLLFRVNLNDQSILALNHHFFIVACGTLWSVRLLDLPRQARKHIGVSFFVISHLYTLSAFKSKTCCLVWSLDWRLSALLTLHLCVCYCLCVLIPLSMFGTSMCSFTRPWFSHRCITASRCLAVDQCIAAPAPPAAAVVAAASVAALRCCCCCCCCCCC